MKEFEATQIDSEPAPVNPVTQGGAIHQPSTEGLLRRTFLSISPKAVGTAALVGLTAYAQETRDTRKADKDISGSDPGQENKLLLAENPSSNMPPPTDHGDMGPVWYSFDLVHKRVQEGGWTHEVNSKVLPSSKDLAGVNMRHTGYFTGGAQRQRSQLRRPHHPACIQTGKLPLPQEHEQ